MVPQNYVKLTDEEDIKNMEKLLEFLEDNDDVQNVYHNWSRSDLLSGKDHTKGTRRSGGSLFLYPWGRSLRLTTTGRLMGRPRLPA